MDWRGNSDCITGARSCAETKSCSGEIHARLPAQQPEIGRNREILVGEGVGRGRIELKNDHLQQAFSKQFSLVAERGSLSYGSLSHYLFHFPILPAFELPSLGGYGVQKFCAAVTNSRYATKMDDIIDWKPEEIPIPFRLQFGEIS